MKTDYLLFINIGLISLFISSIGVAKEDCQWMVENNSNSNYVMGYGEGSNLIDAKKMALREIVETLQSNITSHLKQTTTLDGEEINILAKSEIEITASMTLENVERNCLSQLKNGSYQVAYYVDQRSTVDKLAEKIEQSFQGKHPKKIEFIGLNPLISGHLIRILSEKINTNNGSDPSVRFNVRLYRNLKGWYLSIGPINQRLLASDIPSLLKWHHSGDSSIKVFSQEKQSLVYSLRENELFKFKLTTSKPGYLTLFNLFYDGRVTQLLPSQTINSQITIPDQSEFESQLTESGKATIDTYIAVITNHPVSSQFTILEEDSLITREESSYVLDRFLGWLSDEDVVSMSLVTIHTLPR